ncbi:hypothetical protein [Croceibacterium aestuarii]|uniref:hypothetical protein n=1 Tax=Croceibacterium aestuarii TaxID=3064139 RepID=UPI00272E88D6|nr:hypothetical protein [Croceibacterium sp. D39]
MRWAGLGILSGLVLGAVAVGAAAQDAPLTAARDFSGVWTTYREPGGPPRAGGPIAATPEVPFTAEGERRRAEYAKLVGEDATPGSFSGDNPAAHCVPYGMPTMMQSAGGYPIEFIMRPEQLTIIYEVESETRRVYMPGHGVPPEKRLPVRQGYSEGRWDGDTLVVTTTDLSDGQDQRTYPHSEEAKIVERFHLVPDEKVGKALEYELTMTDPVYYTQPISFTKKWMPLKDGHIMAYNCTEEPWLRLLDKRREQLEAGEPITAKMADVIDVYE